MSKTNQRGRDIVNKYAIIIAIVCKLYSFLPKKVLKIMLVRSRHSRGKVGMLKRYCILKNLAKRIGNNVSIHPDVYILNPEKIEIGDNVSIHPMTYIEAYGGVTIGNDVSIAHGVTILSASHEYARLDIPIKDQEILKGKVVIGNNVWIGAKATILYKNRVSDGSIIGANCVVTKDVNENEIVGGVPNKILKKRKL